MLSIKPNKQLPNTLFLTFSGLNRPEITATITGNREAAALVSSFLGDLIRAGIVDKDMAYLAVDQSKMQRAKDMVMAKAREKGRQ